MAQPTESPDVEDLGPVSNWDKPHNPALVRKITESGSCTERELESLSIADYAYVRPYLLRAHGLSSYVDHPAIGDEHA